MKEIDLTTFLGIRDSALDREWVKHPRRMYLVGMMKKRADKLLAEAKQAEELAEAEAATRLRRNPKKYAPHGKLTEPGIKELVVQMTEVRRAAANRITAQELADHWKAVAFAMTAKKDALQDLVRLHGMDYFATPRVGQAEEARAMESVRKRRKTQRDR